MDANLVKCKHSRLIHYQCDHYIYHLPHALQTGPNPICDREGGCSAKKLVEESITSVVPRHYSGIYSQCIAVVETWRFAVSVNDKFWQHPLSHDSYV